MEEIDRYAVARLNEVIRTALACYREYDFNGVYRAIHSFCVIDLSNVYLDILKNRLYVERSDSRTRRSAQTAIYTILSAVTRLLAPILCFTTDEIWKELPACSGFDHSAVLLNDMPAPYEVSFSEEDMAKWTRILEVRSDVMKALEEARTAKVIGASLEACVTLHAQGEELEFIRSVEGFLKDVFITSDVHVIGEGKGTYEGETVSVDVEKAAGEKCERCWSYDTTVGQDPDHPTICARCAEVIR